MPAQPILLYPDPRLCVTAAPVVDFDASLSALATDLAESLEAAQAIGLTAPHIGIPLRLVALRLSPGETRLYVNPEILWSSDEKLRHREGSVSMPGLVEFVERPARVRIGYRDLAGIEHVEEAEGWAAACHQHEIDQIDGLFWIFRLSRLKRERLVQRHEKLAQGNSHLYKRRR
ncbi:peptide deformylase [Beijerinckia mobilis]|uniref:peptide deformylase n=1 Tax=Beijerinckia mobilis TaxID=231434 RepID=UPI000555D191|nr:peptide deformylase [Beijerinckia mobilis]